MMKVSSQLSSLYNDLRAIANDLNDYIDIRLKEACSEKKWLYTRRVKELESFALKMEMGRYKSINLIDDMFACTLVVSNIAELNEAESYIKEHFSIIKRKPKNSNESIHMPENFNYDSLRLYCQVKPSRLQKDYEHMIFEVQIKTFLEHAWAVATHDFQYKSNEISWAKSRIVSQLKAMLDNIELTIHESESLSKSKHIKKVHSEYKHLNNIIEYYQTNWGEDKLPKDVRRLAQNTNELIFHLGIEFNEVKKIIEAENKIGKGINTLSLSPFQVIVQSLINQKRDLMKNFMKSPKKRGVYPGRYNILLTSGMNIPEDFDRSKSLYIEGNEVNTQLLNRANNS